MITVRHRRAAVAATVLLGLWLAAAQAEEFRIRINDDDPADQPATGQADEEVNPFADEPEEAIYNAGPRPAQNWVRAEYLTWWTRGNRLPDLVTTSPSGTAQADAGVLGRPGTGVLFGENPIDSRHRLGLRIGAGRWLDDARTTALEADYFSAFDDTDTGDFAARTSGALGGGTGLPILTRPFFNADTGVEDSQLISYPALVDGTIGVSSSSEMHSASLSLRQNWRTGTRGRVDLVGGYRFFRFREGLSIDEHLVSTAPGGPIAQGTTFDVFDSFAARNDFHGGELGLAAQFSRGPLTLDLLAKVGLGNVRRTVVIDGATTIVTPPPGSTTSTRDGGLLALSTNMGRHTWDDFAVLPEFRANLMWDLWSGRRDWKVAVGYTLLMLNDVARTGGAIDRSVNPPFLPGSGPPVGAARPAFFHNTTDFWAQGINIGLIIEG